MKTNNKKLLDWVAEVEAMCQPDQVEWADGSQSRIRPADAADGRHRAWRPS